MDAVKFLKEYKRLCDECSSCIKCPLEKFEDCIKADPEEVVKAVEKWSAYHPLLTNGAVAVGMMEKMDATYIQYTKNEVGQVEMLLDASWWDAEYKGAEWWMQ